MSVISLINMKGGVGKTTLAINIADCLASRHDKKVLLLDVDPQFNCTQSLMNPKKYVKHLKENKDTIINVFERIKRPVANSVNGIGVQDSKALEDIELVKVRPNLYLLPGSLELYRMEMSPGEGREYKLLRYIEAIKEKYEIDITIIDTPPTPSIWMTSALLASDNYLIPVKPDPMSFTGIDLLESIIEDKRTNLDLKIKCLGLVLTMVEDGTLIYKGVIKSIANNTKWSALKLTKEIPKRTEIAREQLNQKFILDNSDGKAKIALTGLVNEILLKL